ncbi:phosphotransferase family protein [Solwaraspora sp. WMMB335]|uniref:phosphotransferase family protein n=1 Tax=Solwaraspora sp. WMMB335 TaxID=3404118 RepID=UPI003B92583A
MTISAELIAVRQAAAGPAAALAPPVAGQHGSRPRLRRIPGPRLDDRVLTAGPTSNAASRTAGALLRRAGALLAALHQRRCPVPTSAAGLGYPWSSVQIQTWLGLSSGQRRLAAQFAADPQLCHRAQRLADGLAEGRHWLHGDARADNICVTSDGLPLLIDWEFTGTGRPERDLGTLTASLIAIAVTSTCVTNGDPAAARAELRSGIAWARRLVSAVTGGYRQDQPIDLDPALLAGAAGLALITTAWARCAQLSLDRRNQALVLIGTGLVDHPERWRLFDDDGC